jgi:hypothetical protein
MEAESGVIIDPDDKDATGTLEDLEIADLSPSKIAAGSSLVSPGFTSSQGEIPEDIEEES